MAGVRVFATGGHRRRAPRRRDDDGRLRRSAGAFAHAGGGRLRRGQTDPWTSAVRSNTWRDDGRAGDRPAHSGVPRVLLPQQRASRSTMRQRARRRQPAIIHAQRALGLGRGACSSATRSRRNTAWDNALYGARHRRKRSPRRNGAGVRGKAITPFLLARVKALTGGASFEANVQLALKQRAGRRAHCKGPVRAGSAAVSAPREGPPGQGRQTGGRRSRGVRPCSFPCVLQRCPRPAARRRIRAGLCCSWSIKLMSSRRLLTPLLEHVADGPRGRG